MSEIDHRSVAAELFNQTWTLMDKNDRTTAEDDAMLHMAHASRHHWGQVGGPEHLARGEWQISRVYTVLGRGEPALYHARRCVELCQQNGIADWDLAFAYEALARAAATAGEFDRSQTWLAEARRAATEITDDEDRDLVLRDLATIPTASGQPHSEA